MNSIQSALLILQLILAGGNLIIMIWMLSKFLLKPHDDLKERIKRLEVDIDEIKSSLLQGNDRFREQRRTIEVLIRCVFALLEFEVHYCETEQKPISKNLEKAKDELHDYLSKQ